MKIRVFLGAVAFLFIFVATASALTVLNFEGLPTTYWHNGGSDTNIGSYYSGVNFGPDATILDKTNSGYNYTGFPPHSGNAVFFSYTTDYVDIIFNNPATYVEGWFTFNASSGYMEAYDSLNQPVDSDSMSANYGSNAMMSVSGSGITRVRIHDSGNMWTGDDIGYEGGVNIVPEPATLSLLGLGLVGLLGIRKKIKV